MTFRRCSDTIQDLQVWVDIEGSPCVIPNRILPLDGAIEGQGCWEEMENKYSMFCMLDTYSVEIK